MWRVPGGGRVWISSCSWLSIAAPGEPGCLAEAEEEEKVFFVLFYFCIKGPCMWREISSIMNTITIFRMFRIKCRT